MDHGPGARRGLWRALIPSAVVVLAIAAAAIAWSRWEGAVIHDAELVSRRTTTDGILIELERGDVRWQHLCGDPAESCTERVPGYLVRFTLPDGRTGATPLADQWIRRGGPGVLTVAGLGVAPGSEEEQMIIVRTEGDVAEVVASRADGTTDEAEPVGGLVVLATRTGWDAGAPIEVVAADGSRTTLDRGP